MPDALTRNPVAGLDAVFRTPTGVVCVPAHKRPLPALRPGLVVSVSIADLRPAGRDDVVVVYGDGTFAILERDPGSTGFADVTGVRLPGAQEQMRAAYGVYVADGDADGFLDLYFVSDVAVLLFRNQRGPLVRGTCGVPRSQCGNRSLHFTLHPAPPASTGCRCSSGSSLYQPAIFA